MLAIAIGTGYDLSGLQSTSQAAALAGRLAKLSRSTSQAGIGPHVVTKKTQTKTGALLNSKYGIRAGLIRASRASLRKSLTV